MVFLRFDFNSTTFDENHFWNRRPDGMVINKNLQTVHILEFDRSSDNNEDFLGPGVKEDEVSEQQKIIIKALKAAAPE